ncbi:MAG: HAMP domain-containing histidine kinase [Lachnospiraceae bacterium]|nr:HAMP domain-containing histidine kinase [Lachnospiraceae bacterium]
MRHFFRTIPGKVILFITCIISTCMIVACVIGVAVLVEGGFYTAGENEVTGEAISNEIVYDWLDIYNHGVFEERDGVREYRHDGNLLLNVYDENGNLTARTEGADGFATEDFGPEYEVLMYRNGSYYASVWNYLSVRSQYYGFDIDMSGFPADLPDNITIKALKIKASFKAGFPDNDWYGLIYRAIHIGYGLRYAIFGIGAAAALLALISFIALMCVSARRREDEELHPGLLHKVPSDLILAAVAAVIVLYITFLDEFFNTDMEGMIISFVALPFVLSVLLGFFMGVAARIKDRSILTNTLILRLLKLLKRAGLLILHGLKKCAGLIGRLIISIPMAWKAVALILADAAVNLLLLVLAFYHEEGVAILFLIVKTLLLAGFAIFVSMKIRTLREGAAQLAGGHLDLAIDTAGMLPEMKKHALDLNSIGNGMNLAIEQKLKSERMKAELITNVSHDIKTPLTSIINYTGLIATENCDNDKHSQYSEVLLRQAERLKRLLEDLVEASKAATGNLDVSLAPCDAAVFISQASGEYEEKLEASQLSLVIRQPEENLRIMADGRRMWRIFDNLMNNIYKYSLPGSRVYLTLERFGDTARFIFKNTSKDVLDISEDELMERFVRGDSSRNTEGNGLGLSIAKSMAQLQNGTLRLETDGDLFKAILTFPLLEE